MVYWVDNQIPRHWNKNNAPDRRSRELLSIFWFMFIKMTQQKCHIKKCLYFLIIWNDTTLKPLAMLNLKHNNPFVAMLGNTAIVVINRGVFCSRTIAEKAKTDVSQQQRQYSKQSILIMVYWVIRLTLSFYSPKRHY